MLLLVLVVSNLPDVCRNLDNTTKVYGNHKLSCGLDVRLGNVSEWLYHDGCDNWDPPRFTVCLDRLVMLSVLPDWKLSSLNMPSFIDYNVIRYVQELR